MGDYASIEQVIELAQRRWPGLVFERKSSTEAASACPFCHQAVRDGFLCFENGRFFCRKCSVGGWVDDDTPRTLTTEELNEIRLRRLERRQEEQDRRLSQLERMHRSQDHIQYHGLLDDTDRAWWHKQGINDESIDRYLLGICYNCPTDALHRPSHTIPVVNHGKLWNIRHRLINVDGGDKYRPHLAGLGNTLFNADNLYRGLPSILLVEGEKKSIVLDQFGFPSVGMMGMRAFPAPWAKRFEKLREVVVLLDPDARDQAYKTAALFGGRGKVATLPVKCDDFFVQGGTVEEFRWFLKWARPAS